MNIFRHKLNPNNFLLESFSSSTLLAIIILTSGADLFSLNTSGITLRLAWLIPIIIFVLNIRSTKFSKTDFNVLIAFAFTLTPTIIISNSPSRSFFYVFWLIFNFFVFYSLSRHLAIKSNVNIWKIVAVCGRLQIVVAAILVLIGIHQRAHLLYYEPSYMSLALTPFIAYTVLLSTTKKLDYLLLALYTVTSQSANFVFIFILVYIFAIFYTDSRVLILKKLTILAFSVFLVVLIILNAEQNINTPIAKTILSSSSPLDLIFEILMRGGNRFPRIISAFHVFQETVFTGVGIGGYETYSLKHNITNLNFSEDYLDPSGLPPINIYLEVAVTGGIIAGIFFLIWCLSFAVRLFRSRRDIRCGAWMIVFFAIGIVLAIESNYLRGYIWTFAGIAAGTLVTEKRKFRTTCTAT